MLSPVEDPTFRAVYDRYFDHVARYCLRRLPEVESHDAVSEVFLVVWRRIDEIPDGDETLLWLYSVARNVVRNAERSQRRVLRVLARMRREPQYAQSGPEIQVVRHEEDEMLLWALEQLKPEDREVLRLRTYEQLTTPEIAAVLDCSDAAARKRIARAIQRLRRTASIANESIPGSVRNKGEDR